MEAAAFLNAQDTKLSRELTSFDTPQRLVVSASTNSRSVPGSAEAGGRLVYLVIGGVASGLILGKIINWLEHPINHSPIEITISLVTPYLAYVAAERIHASGVLAAVVCGRTLSRASERDILLLDSADRSAGLLEYPDLRLERSCFCSDRIPTPYVQTRIESVGLWRLILRGGLFSAVVILLWGRQSCRQARFQAGLDLA